MTSVRELYKLYGVETFYKEHQYTNHHQNDIEKVISKLSLHGRILDLCAGDGLVSRCLSNYDIVGCEPYLYEKYITNTCNFCYKYSFKDIVTGSLKDNFDVIICSFALHLCDKSMLNSLLYQLSIICDEFIVIAPSDTLEIKHWFRLKESFKVNRVHCKIYESIS